MVLATNGYFLAIRLLLNLFPLQSKKIIRLSLWWEKSQLLVLTSASKQHYTSPHIAHIIIKKISKDSRILGYFINGFFKCSTTLCKILIKKVIIQYLKDTSIKRSKQNKFKTPARLIVEHFVPVYNRLQKRWHLAKKHDPSTMRLYGFMGNVRTAYIINALLFHYSWQSLFTIVHFFNFRKAWMASIIYHVQPIVAII